MEQSKQLKDVSNVYDKAHISLQFNKTRNEIICMFCGMLLSYGRSVTNHKRVNTINHNLNVLQCRRVIIRNAYIIKPEHQYVIVDNLFRHYKHAKRS